MSKKEKQRFWKFIQSNAGGNADEKYVRLYEAISRGKCVNPDSLLKKIYEGDQKAMADGCRYLVIKIIECAACHHPHSRTELLMADIAIEKGFVKLASRWVRQELKKAAELNDTQYLKDVYERVRQLQGYYGEPITLGDGIPALDKVLQENLAVAQADVLYRQFIKALPPGSREAMDAHEASREEVMQLDNPFYSPKTRARILKIKSIWNTLGREYVAASRMHEQIVDLHCTYADLFSPGQKIEELRVAISLSMHLKQWDTAENRLVELGSMEPDNELLERLINQTWIQGALFLGACGGKAELGKVALTKFSELSGIYTKFTRAYLTHTAVIAAITLDDWEQAESLTRKLSRMGTHLQDDFKVVIPAMRALVYFRQNKIAEARREISILNIQDSSPRGEYVRCMHHVLEAVILEYETGVSSRLMLENQATKLESILGDTESAHYAQFFNIQPFLDSVLENRSMLELVESGKTPALMALRMSS